MLQLPLQRENLLAKLMSLGWKTVSSYDVSLSCRLCPPLTLLARFPHGDLYMHDFATMAFGI